MILLTSFQELDALGEALVKDFFRRTRKRDPASLDIEGFIRDYLCLHIAYDRFAEEDGGKIGFFSDGMTPLLVWRDGRKTPVIYPGGTLVIERYLQRNEESGRRRFTMAHEAAHAVLARHVPMQMAAGFRSEYDGEAAYEKKDLERIFSLNEAFANRLGAALLMPRFLVEKALRSCRGGKKIVCYEGGVFSQKEKLAAGKTADMLGVSYSALVNRLRELDLLEFRPVSEYLERDLGIGGSF